MTALLCGERELAFSVENGGRGVARGCTIRHTMHTPSHPSRRAASSIAVATALLMAAACASCQGSGGSSDDGLAKLEGSDRAEGRELTDIDMAHEMDEMSGARSDAAESEIEGGD